MPSMIAVMVVTLGAMVAGAPRAEVMDRWMGNCGPVEVGDMVRFQLNAVINRPMAYGLCSRHSCSSLWVYGADKKFGYTTTNSDTSNPADVEPGEDDAKLNGTKTGFTPNHEYTFVVYRKEAEVMITWVDGNIPGKATIPIKSSDRNILKVESLAGPVSCLKGSSNNSNNGEHSADYGYGTYSWHLVRPGLVPARLADVGLVAGINSVGEQSFVGRSFRGKDIIPGKAYANGQSVSASSDGTTVEGKIFEVLSAEEVTWEYAADGNIPEGAFQTGMTSMGESLYTCRAVRQSLILEAGNLQPSKRLCFIVGPANQHIFVPEYEVLVVH